MAPMALLLAHLIFCWLLAACVPVPGGTSTAPPWLPQHPFLGMALQSPQNASCLYSFSPLQGLSLLWSTYGPWLSFWSCLAVGGRDFCQYPSHLQQTVPRIRREWRAKGTACDAVLLGVVLAGGPTQLSQPRCWCLERQLSLQSGSG